MSLHVPTLLIVLVVLSGMLWLSVCAADRRAQDGMRYWGAGMALQMFSYLMLISVGQLGDFLAYGGSGLLRSCAWSAFTMGLCQFYRLPPRPWQIGLPVLLMGLAFVGLNEHPNARVALINVILAAQGVLVLAIMWPQRHTTPGHGQYFLVIGLALASTLLLIRAAAAIGGASPTLLSLTQSSTLQGLSLLGVIATLVLLAFGFVIMSKDRADHLTQVLTIRDDLTGLANRRHLNEVLAAEWDRAQRSGQPLSVAMIDIDQFKLYNDHYGHQAGDACLVQVARQIEAGARRTGDLAARYGGEEFLLILPDADASVAQPLAERVRREVQALQIAHASSTQGHVTISIGVATLCDGLYSDAQSLLRAADQALYRAKAKGRNQVHAAAQAPGAEGLSSTGHPRLVQLIWRRSYECGHPLIDAEHQALFTEVNQLLAAALNAQAGADAAGQIDAFLHHMAQHFEEEEALFSAIDYPGASGHITLHRSLIAKAHDLTQRFRAAEVPVGELFEFLAHDLVARHVLIADRQFYSHLPKP